MKKIIENGERVATITLDGSECEVVFSSNYSVFNVRSSGDVVVALESGKAKGDDGTMLCKSGEPVFYPHMRKLNKLYLTGSGEVTVFASNEPIPLFKSALTGTSGGIITAYAECDCLDIPNIFVDNVEVIEAVSLNLNSSEEENE